MPLTVDPPAAAHIAPTQRPNSAAATPQIRPFRGLNLPRWLCFRLARRLVLRSRPGDVAQNPDILEQRCYEALRTRELKRELDQHFGRIEFNGRDVLDLGCGRGELAVELARRGARSVTGVDVEAGVVADAEAQVAELTLPVRPRFVVADDPTRIPAATAGIDLITCFDTLEHVMAYEQIMAECVRVLRPGGRVLIHWVPWYHPWGPHINGLIPIPWAHVLFSEATLIDTCARIYDLPEFVPKFWDRDAAGRKKPNKWRDMPCLGNVNRLTMARFESCCARVGLRIERRIVRGFGGSRLGRMTGLLTMIPWVREFFTSHAVYELTPA